MAKKTTDDQATTPKPKLRTGWDDPLDVKIIGLDILEGQPGYDPELEDPDRIKDKPAKEFVDSLIANGVDGPIRVQEVKIDGKTVRLVVNGRQTTMGLRLANEELAAEHKMLVPWYVKPGADATAIDVTRANEFAKIDSVIVKARRAARLKARGYTDKDIVAAFSDTGARPITKMTLSNWRSLLNCCQVILDQIEDGTLPVAVGYELGRIKHSDPSKRAELQLGALAKIEEEGGKLTGAEGRTNLRAAMVVSDEGEGEDDDKNKPRRMKGKKLSVSDIRRALAVFEDESEEGTPYTDLHPKTNAVQRMYTDGDYQRLTYALLALMSGNDPTGLLIKQFPSVARHLVFMLRSPKEERDKGDK